MRKLTATLCLTIPVLLGFFGVFAPNITVKTAQAMKMVQRGDDTIVLSGRVVDGDCWKLEKKINERTKKIVLTRSGGGRAIEGYCIGELIREKKLNTEIEGRCASSCSRMWLGGVQRTLNGSRSRVGLHSNYKDGFATWEGTQKLRDWIPRFSPHVDKKLMREWTSLDTKNLMMYFYNDRAELCSRGGGRDCKEIPNLSVFSAGLSHLRSVPKLEKDVSSEKQEGDNIAALEKKLRHLKARKVILDQIKLLQKKLEVLDAKFSATQ